jgi:phosphonate transport system substrate-binding protein
MTHIYFFLRWISAAVIGIAAGCSTSAAQNAGAAPNAAIVEYVFGVTPGYHPEQSFSVYDPIVSYLETQLSGVHLKLEPSPDYAEYERRIRDHRYAFAITNPYQTILALDSGYRVFGKFGDDQDFRGLILVRRDSGVDKVTDLKGKIVSFIAPTNVVATMLPQYYLQTHGVDVKQDIHSIYTGSHESSILNVFYGFSAAGATRPGHWRLFQRKHPEKAEALIVKWETESLINNAFIARDDVPQALVNQVGAILFSFKDTETGRRFLEAIPASNFEPANNATYEPARIFLRRFEASVGPLRDN